jgi:putative tryptophan/tyrosine transport system substrate-binding protein
MRRREFIMLLGGAAAAAGPRAASAQQPERMRRIGVLMSIAETDLEALARVRALEQGLQKLGLTKGKNVIIESSVMNSRRFMGSPPQAGSRTLAGSQPGSAD